MKAGFSFMRSVETWTSGAESSAPPGMGRKPMMAGETMATRRLSRIMVFSESIRRSYMRRLFCTAPMYCTSTMIRKSSSVSRSLTPAQAPRPASAG